MGVWGFKPQRGLGAEPLAFFRSLLEHFYKTASIRKGSNRNVFFNRRTISALHEAGKPISYRAVTEYALAEGPELNGASRAASDYRPVSHVPTAAGGERHDASDCDCAGCLVGIGGRLAQLINASYYELVILLPGWPPAGARFDKASQQAA